MSTNENEPLDQYERCLDRLFSALTVPSREQLPVITAIEENRSGVPEIKEQFEVSSNLQQLKLEKDNARRAFDESGPHKGQIAQHAEKLRKWENMLDAAAEEISIGVPINFGIGGLFAFERDPSGEKIGKFLETLLGVNFAREGVAIRGEEDRVGLARHLGHQAAFKFLSRDVFRRAETFVGKGPAYFAQTFRNEQQRIIRDEEIEDRNHLGGTPKESRDLSDDGREQIRALNRTAVDIDDLTTVAALSSSANPEEIVLEQEEERRIEAELNLFSGQLSSDQREFFDRWREGESPTDIRERLGFPMSIETALRNKLKRWRELRAQQAS